MDFERLGLCDELIRAIIDEYWERPTDCQEEAIPLILGGGDVLLAAPTGSGKTAAFGLPILQVVWEMLQREIPPTLKDETLCLNYLDSDKSVQISSDGTTAINKSNNWGGCRATMGVFNEGQYYYECKIQNGENGICRLGWSALSDRLNLGSSATSYGYGGTGKKVNKGVYEDYGESFTVGDVIGCCINLNSNTISYTKNGIDLGIAYTNLKKGIRYFPTICIKNCTVQLTFEKPFSFAYPHYESIPILSSSSNEMGSNRYCLALILEPTRELAQQTYDCLMRYKEYMTNPSINIALLTGGERVNYRNQGIELKKSHIIVATTSRFFDALNRHSLSLNNLLFFILDEADKLVEDDEHNEILKIFNRIPARNNANNEYRLQTCLFSATLHSDAIKSLASKVCVNPLWVDLKGKDYVPDRVQQCAVFVDVKDCNQMKNFNIHECSEFSDKVHEGLVIGDEINSAEEMSEVTKRVKYQLVKKLIDKYNMDKIFCRTNLDCNNLESYFIHIGNGVKMESGNTFCSGGMYGCTVLAGMRDTRSRKNALESFRDGAVRILICTDVAARGIDIKEVPYVINFTLPDSSEQYMHRIGRVGRADSIGLAFSIISKHQEKVWYHTCKRKRTDIMHCHNTKLTSEGGCCIWYDELKLLGDIEKKVGMTIPVLDSNLELPKGIDLASVKKGKNAKLIEIASKNAETIKQNVVTLAKLEYQTQSSYLYMISHKL